MIQIIEDLLKLLHYNLILSDNSEKRAEHLAHEGTDSLTTRFDIYTHVVKNASNGGKARS